MTMHHTPDKTISIQVKMCVCQIDSHISKKKNISFHLSEYNKIKGKRRIINIWNIHQLSYQFKNCFSKTLSRYICSVSKEKTSTNHYKLIHL